VSQLPPVSTLFAAFLGYNPIQHLLGTQVLAQVPKAQQAVLTGRSFFPSIITGPFRSGLHAALDFAIGASFLAAAASWTRGVASATAPSAPPAPVQRTPAPAAATTTATDAPATTSTTAASR
jgi:hypothetical protein